MIFLVVVLFMTLAISSGIAWAQGFEDPMVQLRACSLVDRTQREDCLDRLSRTISPDSPSPREGPNWTISETTSPVDYSPIISAMTSSRGGGAGPTMKLWIGCRSGRTEMWLEGSEISGHGNDDIISLRINDGPSLQVPAIASVSRQGVAVGGDVIRLVQSLPDSGVLAVHLSMSTKNGHDAVFALGGFESVRAKMAPICKWPRAAAKSRN